MRILFVNPHYPYDPYTLLLHPPLAFGYLATALRPRGHELFHADLPLHGNQAQSLVPFLNEVKPDLVCLTCVAQSYRQALDAATVTKAWRLDVPVVIGGPHVTFIASEALERHLVLDFVVLYDGEDALVALTDALAVGATTTQLEMISGLAFRSEGGIRVTTPAPPVSDLDRYGWPDRTLFEMDRYLAYDYETVVMTARGCPSRCTFCSTTQIGRRYRWHGVKHVCDEFEQVINLGFSSIFIGDDTFSGNTPRTLEFCAEMKRRGINIPWTSNMRALDAQPHVLDAIRVFMGFESIRDDTLKLVKKGTTTQRLDEKGQLVKAHGLELHASFIVGAPGDTHESLAATLDFIRVLNPTVATFNVMEPRPGTDVYSNPVRYGLHIPDPYWYETTAWVDGPVCSTSTLSQDEIREWVDRCYDEFCSADFRSPENLARVEAQADTLLCRATDRALPTLQ
jgi:anaerobic magnesium-protoporphyrin IX monomethyl ester cyclase